MEPSIQYAQTKDGVSIAFWTMGVGLPLVHLPGTPFQHIQLEWQFPELRRWYERLAEKRQLVRYDGRGAGLSECRVTDFPLESRVLDLETVVDRLELERFALFGPLGTGVVAIAYAARHPERVSHLILWCAWARNADLYQSPQAATLRALSEQDWETFTETLAHVMFGWSEGEQARRVAALTRESITRETWQVMSLAARADDVTALLPQIKSPTLVFHRRQIPFPTVDIARGLASRIPEARLVLLEGTSPIPLLEDLDAVVTAIDELPGEGEEAAAGAEALVPGGLVTILFTDMESSTATRQRLGDAKAQELVRIHNTIVREALKAHGGSETKHTGDGIMASFTTASSALACAIAIQQSVAAHKEEHPDSPLGVYIGLNAGEPIAEEGDLFGTTIDLAARICDHAQPGQILASDVVRQLAAGKDFLFADLGGTELRGFEDPVRLYELRWREEW